MPKPRDRRKHGPGDAVGTATTCRSVRGTRSTPPVGRRRTPWPSDEARLQGVDSVGTRRSCVGREFAINQRGQTYGYPLILWVALRYFRGATHNLSGYPPWIVVSNQPG
ncbi:MAG: hypothetical protein QOF10_3694 [Kribbellaceae bacterium]|jgi:hypothetical protein|nr:hypothetical protein [Kribbellaceae bacterium]